MADMPLEVMTLSELAVKIEFSVNQVRLFSMGHLGRVAPIASNPRGWETERLQSRFSAS